MDLSDLEFNYYWDKDVDDSKRVLLKAKLQPGQIAGEYDLLERSGSINAKLISNGYKLDLTYDMLFFNTQVTLKNEADGFYGIKAEVQSSLPVMKDMRIMIKHYLKEKPGTDVSRLDSRVSCFFLHSNSIMLLTVFICRLPFC